MPAFPRDDADWRPLSPTTPVHFDVDPSPPALGRRLTGPSAARRRPSAVAPAHTEEPVDPVTIDLWSVASCWSHLRSSSHRTLTIAGTNGEVCVGVAYAFTERGPVIFVAVQDELGRDTRGRQLVLETTGHDDHGPWVVRVTGSIEVSLDPAGDSRRCARLVDPRIRGYTATPLLG